MTQLVPSSLQPQTEQVGRVYQCGHFAKRVGRELKVQSALTGGA